MRRFVDEDMTLGSLLDCRFERNARYASTSDVKPVDLRLAGETSCNCMMKVLQPE